MDRGKRAELVGSGVLERGQRQVRPPVDLGFMGGWTDLELAFKSRERLVLRGGHSRTIINPCSWHDQGRKSELGSSH